MDRIVHRRKWLLVVVGISVAAAVILVIANPRVPNKHGGVSATRPAVFASHRSSVVPRHVNVSVPGDAANRIFNGDLTVEGGETIADDAIVYDGDVRVAGGGQISGNLVVYSGDIEIESGGSIGGDVTAFSGDIDIQGSVRGNVNSWSGDVALGDTASVGGDISVVSGEIDRADGATVGGNIVQGPNFNFLIRPPRPFNFGNDLSGAQDRPLVGRTASFAERIFTLILRMIAAGLITALVALLTGLVTFVRPELVVRVRKTLETESALSFVTGLFVNLVLLLLSGLLTVTLCLAPLALVPGLILLGLNLVGWAAISYIAGDRISSKLGVTVQPAVSVAMGAVVFAGSVGLLWALGSCFRVFGFVIWLVVGSLGVGAVLLPWIRQRTVVTPVSEPTNGGPGSGAEASTDAPAEAAEAASVMPEEPAAEGDVDLDTEGTVGGKGDQLEEVLDDFTRIKGVGPVFDRRLKEAGVRTFAQLARMTPEEIAEIIGWPAERVNRSELIEQARNLAGSS